MKTCSKCKIEQNKENFTKSKSRKDGLASYCRKCTKIKTVIRYRDNPEYNKIYYAKNKERIKRDVKKWANLHLDKVRKIKSKWKKNNKAYTLAETRKRQALKTKAMPKWLTKDQLKEIANMYKRAKELEKTTGLKYHVDHIIPLKGKDVCGLHTPWNLQILTAEENIKKSNKVIKENR